MLTNHFIPGINCSLSAAESALDEFVDYKAHYYANHRAFFILFSCFTPVDVADSLLKGIPHFLGLGPQYFISGIIFLPD